MLVWFPSFLHVRCDQRGFVVGVDFPICREKNCFLVFQDRQSGWVCGGLEPHAIQDAIEEENREGYADIWPRGVVVEPEKDQSGDL